MNTVVGSTRPDTLVLGLSWRSALLAAFAVLVLLGVFFRHPLTAMVDVWQTSDSYGHGFLIAPICAWLVWRERARLAAYRPAPDPTGLLLVAGACVAWIVAEVAGINVLGQFAVVSLVPAVVVSLLGWRAAAAMWFPLLFLFFMVPAGEALVPFLMEGTADVTVWTLRLSGIPVFREGLNFALPTGNWSVVEACSGLRYVIAALVLASLFAYLNFTRLTRQLLFVLAALLVAVLANWARAYLIVLIGHFSGMTLAVGDDHVVYGWLFFGLVMFAVFWMGARWRDRAEPDVSREAAAADRLGAPAGEREAAMRPAAARGRPPGAVTLVACAILALAIGLTSQHALARMRDVQPSTRLQALVRETLLPIDSRQTAVVPQFDHARDRAFGQLDAATATEFYVAYYALQWEGAEMINYANSVVPEGDRHWRIVSRTRREVGEGDRHWLVEQLRLRSGPQQRLLWYWYTIDGRQLVGDYAAKAMTARSMLRGHGDHSTVNVVMTDPEVDPARAEARLARAAAALSRVGSAIAR